MALPGYLAALAALPGYTLAQVQPAGVDLRVGEVQVLDGEGVLGEGERVVPPGRRVEPRNGYWLLGPGAYRVVFADEVRVPLNAVGLCFPRSSLLRMGAVLHCAVWDPGYHGRGEALLTVHNPHGVRIGVGARIAQLVLVRVEPPPHKAYQGVYQGERLQR